MVEVPVTVVDRAGNPIRNLTAENFRIVDEGVERAITSFDSVDFASAESLKATSPLNPAARRNFMLLFDLSYSSPTSIARAQQAARDFVMKMVQKRDRVSVGTVDADKGFRLVTAFTTDRALLNAAIANPTTYRGNDPLQIASSITAMEAPSTAGSGERGASANAEINEVVRRTTRNEDHYNRARIDRQLDLISGLARSLRAIAGQKNIVFLSEGFESRLVQGRAAGLDADQQRDNDSVERGQIWNVDNDNRFGSASSISLLDRMAQACRRSDVILHAVDIKGIRSDTDAQTGFDRKSNEGLYLLANATGGTVVKNSNDIASDFQRVIKHHEVSYVLGFNAPTSQPGKFHKLTVKIVGVPNAKLTARAGYFEAGRENAVERSLSNAEIVLNDIPQDAIRVAELAAPFATAGRNAQVPVILEIDGRDLIRASRNDVATTEIFVYAFDDEGLVRDSLYEKLELDLSQAAAKLRDAGVKYYGTLSLGEGRYAIKSLVRVLETEQRGFARRDVVVPYDNDVAMSEPMFVEEPGRWVLIKGASHDKTNAAYPFEVDGEPFIPSAAVRIARGEPRKFVVFVQNATPDEMTMHTTPATTILSQLRSTTGSKLVFKLDAAANASTLSVTMRKNGSTDERSVSVPLLQP